MEQASVCGGFSPLRRIMVDSRVCASPEDTATSWPRRWRTLGAPLPQCALLPLPRRGKPALPFTCAAPLRKYSRMASCASSATATICRLISTTSMPRITAAGHLCAKRAKGHKDVAQLRLTNGDGCRCRGHQRRQHITVRRRGGAQETSPNFLFHKG